MKKLIILILSFILGIFSYSDEIKGNLVIVGGALSNKNEEVYKQFIELAGGKNAKIGIIPTASGNLNSSNNFKNDLINYGLKAENIEILPITKHDFKKTAENEADTWKGNENNLEIVKKIENLTGVWFVGGDQTLITKALKNEDGTNSKALNSLWKIYSNGAVLGGTSAGAAIMSDIMITAGDSLGALKDGISSDYLGMESQEAGPLTIEEGLGFFKYGIIDQHYDTKARLGRTILANFKFGKNNNRAYGIDEDTALIYNAKNKEITVAGTGNITVINTALGNITGEAPKYEIKNVEISLINKGDKIDLLNNKIIFNEAKQKTKGYEYITASLPLNTGAVSTYGQLKYYLAYGLVDNVKAESIKTYSFDEMGIGYEWIFEKQDKTEGFYSTKNGGVDDYSIKDVVVNILPIKVKIEKR